MWLRTQHGELVNLAQCGTVQHGPNPARCKDTDPPRSVLAWVAGHGRVMLHTGAAEECERVLQLLARAAGLHPLLDFTKGVPEL